MGKWGRKFSHNKWDWEGFAGQSDDFIKKIDEGKVKFGFSAAYHGGLKDDITVADVRWVARRLNAITDSQLRTALRQSGATAHEARHFARALRLRMKQLARIASIERKDLRQLTRR